MKLIIASPLFPPDIADPAPYVKRLAELLKEDYEVTVVAYGRLPEKIDGVKILTADKRRPLPFRIWVYIFLLVKECVKADILFFQNGPSVELPAVFAALCTRVTLDFNISDLTALHVAKKGGIKSVIFDLALSVSKIVLSNESMQDKKCRILAMPMEKPEILPLEEHPSLALENYKASWKEYLSQLSKIFIHARN